MRSSAPILVCALLIATDTSGQETGWVLQESGTGVVRGRVVAAASGRPLSRARVTLTPEPGNPRYLVADEQGSFEFAGLPAGEYELSAAMSGYITLGLAQSSPSDRPRRLVLEDGQVRSNLEIALPAGGVIEVRVTDESGAPVEGAFAQAQRPGVSANGELALAATVARTQRTFSTDDHGILRLYGLEPGNYYVSATPPVVLGQRHDAEHRKATGHLQTFYPGVVELSDAEPIALALGEEVIVDIVMARPYAAARREPNGAITVHVTDDAGNPRGGVKVAALEVKGEAAQRTLTRARSTATSSPRFWEKKEFYTDDRGDVRIYGLPAGEYAVVAEPLLGDAVDREHGDRALAFVPIYFPGSPSRADAHAISIRPWDEVSLDLALTPTRAARISGRVIKWDGEPGRAFVVLAWNPAGPLYPQGLIGDAMFRVDVVDGEFTFFDVPPGDYIIRTSYDPASTVRDGLAEIPVTLETEDISDLVLTTRPR